VQISGGFRSREQVETWINKGAGRIAIGTLAARDPYLVQQLVKYYPDRIVLAVDIWRGQVITDGWRTVGAFAPETFVAAFPEASMASVILMDVAGDVEDTDAQLGLISGLAADIKAPVIARGMVNGSDDIARMKYIPNISGAIVERALSRKTVDLTEAIAIARPDTEPVAEFL